LFYLAYDSKIHHVHVSKIKVFFMAEEYFIAWMYHTLVMLLGYMVCNFFFLSFYSLFLSKNAGQLFCRLTSFISGLYEISTIKFRLCILDENTTEVILCLSLGFTQVTKDVDLSHIHKVLMALICLLYQIVISNKICFYESILVNVFLLSHE
jgi:hypothetical protein